MSLRTVTKGVVARQRALAAVMFPGLALTIGGAKLFTAVINLPLCLCGILLEVIGLLMFVWSCIALTKFKGYSAALSIITMPIALACALWSVPALAIAIHPDYLIRAIAFAGTAGWLALLALPYRHYKCTPEFVYVALIGGSIVSLIPFIWMFTSSFKDSSMIFKDPPQWWPNPWLWGNYGKAFDKLPFVLYTLNTIKITAACMIGQILSCSIVAFGFARLRFPGRNVLFVVLLSTMMLPAQVTMIPVFKIFSTLGWYDTFLPLTVPSFFGSAFFVFLLRQYFMTVPHEMDEAARIDGASTWQVYWRVLLPQVKPALATVAIFAFMAHWNDFLGPLIYLSTPAKRTLALGLYAFQGQYSTDWNYLMAASTVVMLPLLILFFIGQKYFIQGVVISGVKG